MSLMLTRLPPPIEVLVTDIQGPELKVRFGQRTPLLRDVIAEAEDYLRRDSPYGANDPRITFILHVRELHRDKGFTRGHQRFVTYSNLCWGVDDEDGAPMPFCGNVLMPKDVLDAVAYVLVSTDLVNPDPRVRFLKRLRQLKLL